MPQGRLVELTPLTCLVASLSDAETCEGGAPALLGHSVGRRGLVARSCLSVELAVRHSGVTCLDSESAAWFAERHSETRPFWPRTSEPKEKEMTTLKWSESEFAMTVLSDLNLLDPANRIRKRELVERILPIITTDHVVAELGESELASKGFAKHQCPVLFLALSDKHWRPDDLGGSEEERLGMDALSDIVWGETSTSGTVQQALSGRFLLCRTRIRRNMEDPATGVGPVPIQVTFVTENAAVANVYFTTPVTGSLVRKAESITKQLDLAIDRMPENAETVAALLSPAVQDAVNRLSQITARAGLQLGLTSDGKVALAAPKKKAS